jgi:tRNA (mo5U34)-methyltransferase
MNADEVKQFVDSHIWFHAIDLGDGIITPGRKSQAVLGPEAETIFGPLNLCGCSVMDVGAWNGFYTVEATKRGAREVLAIDSLVWLSPYFCGKETFDFVMRRLGLTVQARILDVTEISEDLVGYWDVVLFLDVFYHLFNPIAALKRLAAVVNEVLVMQTWLDLRDHNRPAMVFYPGTELMDDPTNWWGPNRAAIEALLKTVGFERVEFSANPVGGEARGIFHAYKSEQAFLSHKGLAADANRHARSGELRPHVNRQVDYPLTGAEVRALYEILLGRSPESTQIVDTHLSLHKSTISLARAICESEEFRARVKRAANPRLNQQR